MRIFNHCVFDGYISGLNVSTYTDASFDPLLASAEKMALQVVADQVSGGPKITVAIEHSSDRRNWSAKNATAEIASQSIANEPGSTIGADTGNVAGLGYSRLNIALVSGTTPSARIRIFATGHAEHIG